MNSEETVRVFTGPDIVVSALVERLRDLGLEPIVRDDQQNATMFGSGNNFSDQQRIFLRRDELAAAQPTVDAFIEETDSKN